MQENIDKIYSVIRYAKKNKFIDKLFSYPALVILLLINIFSTGFILIYYNKLCFINIILTSIVIILTIIIIILNIYKIDETNDCL